MADSSACVLCGAALTGQRADARFCSAPCRAEASRLKRLLNGQNIDGFRSIADRLKASQKRTQRLLGVADKGRA